MAYRAGKAHSQDLTMAIPWLMALKVIPWGDVIEHAPSVLKAARKLMDRQPAQPPGEAGTPATTTPVSAVPSLGELKNALIAAQGQIDRQAQTQRELTETLAELAEQNARLVSTVEVLRLCTRVLVWGGAAVLLWLTVLTWWA
ncbi:hypothetical protein [Limnohabitans sp.]|jgi:hypothetical protein|uniref:hypothetical protein n=2 Tax=Limnohabitans sp. TaxID=1907725 RepID=UPI0039BD9233